MSRARRVWARLWRALSSAAPGDAHPRVERLSLAVTLLATLWFLLANVWELGGLIGAGHWASAAALGVAGENMWKYGIIAPVTVVTSSPPTPASYYCNHPWGVFWSTAFLVKLFGHQNFVCRLPPVVWSTLTPLLLHGIARGIWGPVAGAISAATFVVIPIALAFGNFNALEVPVIFGVLLCIWGYVRLTKTWRLRWVLVSALGFFHACNNDWAAFFFGAVVLSLMLPRGILFNGRWFPPVDRMRFNQWWALCSATAVAVVLFYIWRFQSAGQLGHLLSQGVARAAGSNLPLSAVLQSRADWIELSFTPLGIFLGKLMVPVLIFRLVVLRRDLELFPLAILVMAVVQYVTFKQGADIHFFWPHYFAPYLALALGGLAASIEGIGRWVAHRFGKPGRWVPALVAASLVGWVPIAMAPAGVAALVLSRQTGGRFDERGDLIHSDIDKMTALRFMRKGWESQTSVAFHEGMKTSWHIDWAIRRPVRGGVVPTTAARGEAQYYVMDTRFASGTELRALAEHFRITAVGPFASVDRAAPAGPLQGFSLSEREPTLLEWYFRQGNDPMFTVAADPFVTWELRHHLGQSENPVPEAAAETFEQRRIAHNAAVATGNAALAARLRQELEAELDKTAAHRMADGNELFGTRLSRGVATRLEVYFLADGPTEREMQFHVSGKVEAAPSWSLLPAATRERAVGMPFDMPTTLWRAGFIYRSRSEIRPRPGRERFQGIWGVKRNGVRVVPFGGVGRTLLVTGG